MTADVFDSAPCGLVVATEQGEITEVNRAFEAMTGRGRAELVGRCTVAELFTTGTRIYYETYASPLLLVQGEFRSVALTLSSAVGPGVPVLVNASLRRRPEDAGGQLHLAVFEATERLAYERELLAARRRAESSEARATSLARTLQQTLIPPSAPAIPGLDIAAAYRPAGTGDEVGGDFYDVFELGNGAWVVVIGDVSGKGAQAAVVTALVRNTVRAAAVRHGSPARVLEVLNEALLADETERFCTAALLLLRRVEHGWSCLFAVGGHSLPLLTGEDGTARALGEPGSLVGLLPAPEFHDSQLMLRRGDRLLLCTDGVNEGRRGRELFGEERIRDILQVPGRSVCATVQALLDAALEFQDQQPRDDIAIIAISIP